MAVNPMLASGVNGFTQATQALNRVVIDVARENTPRKQRVVHDASSEWGDSPQTGDALAELAHDLTDVKLYQRQVQASAKVIETADEVLGFLVDVRV